MENPDNRFRLLIKFMDHKYVNSFLDQGLLFMNNIKYFRTYEDIDVDLRGDVNEGLGATYNANEMVITFGNHKLEGLIGKVDIRYNHEDETNIYCMTKISDKNILDAGENGLFLSERFQKFGDHAVVIAGSNIGIFEKRLKKALSSKSDIYTPRKDNILAKQVKYINRSSHHGQMDVFNKFDEYGWQYEWRIAFKQVSKKKEYSLEIGNLTDIAEVFKTGQFIKLPIKFIKPSL